MKKLITILLFVITTSNYAQILEPVKWSTSVEKISDNEYDLIFNANIEKEWHLYSQHTAEGGALPIIIEKTKESDDYELLGKAVESDTIKKYNETFEVYESYFDNNATLKQRVKLNNKELSKITLNLTGQVCKKKHVYELMKSSHFI